MNDTREASFPPAPDAIVVDAVQQTGSRVKREYDVRIMTGAGVGEVNIVVDGLGAVPRTLLTLSPDQARLLMAALAARLRFAEGSVSLRKRINAAHEAERKAEKASAS